LALQKRKNEKMSEQQKKGEVSSKGLKDQNKQIIEPLLEERFGELTDEELRTVAGGVHTAITPVTIIPNGGLVATIKLCPLKTYAK
jgi:hypothetical protein